MSFVPSLAGPVDLEMFPVRLGGRPLMQEAGKMGGSMSLVTEVRKAGETAMSFKVHLL